MALTLAANITATAAVLRVAGGDVVSVGFRFRIDDELIDLAGFQPYPLIAGRRRSGLDPTRWIVNRGQGGSVAASHTAGASIVAATDAYVSGAGLTQPVIFPDAGTSLSEDIVAALEGAESPSGANPYATAADLGVSATVAIPRLRKITRTHTQLAADTVEGNLISTIYTLQPGDWLLLTGVIITEGFDDSGAPAFEIDSWNGVSQNVLNSAFGPPAVSGNNGVVGLDDLFSDWGAMAQSGPITPLSAAIDIQIRAGFNADGATGSLDVYLLVVEF